MLSIVRSPFGFALLSACLVACTTTEVEDAPEPIQLRVSPSPGCSPTPPTVADGLIEMPPGLGDNAIRNYRVEPPIGWDGVSPVDLVFFFHPCGGNRFSATFNSYTYPMNLMQTGEQALVVIGESDDLCWNLGPDGPDVEFVRRLREEIESAYCIDTDEVHYAGVSSGGFAANGFSCQLGGTSAYAIAGGSFHAPPLSDIYNHPVLDPPTADDCVNPIPIVLMHGANDPVVPFEDYAIPTRDSWLDINGCTTESHPLDYPIDLCNGLPEPCGCEIYDDCTSGAPVVFCVHDGGHTWPSSFRNGSAHWIGTWDAPLSFPEPGETDGSTSGGSSGGGSTGGGSTGSGSTGSGSTGGYGSTGGGSTGGGSTGGGSTGGGTTGVDPTAGGGTGGTTGAGSTGGAVTTDPTTDATTDPTGPITGFDPTDGSTGSTGSTGADATTGGMMTTGVDPTAGGTTGGPDPGPNCAVVLDQDTFEMVDTSRWVTVQNGASEILIDDDELVMYVPSGGGNRAFLRTTEVYDDLSDFSATIEVTDMPIDLTAADIRLELVNTSNWSWVALKTAWGNLQARGNPGGNFGLASWDAAAFRFWRISILDGQMYFEVSADGEVWDLIAERPNPLGVGPLAVVLRAQPSGGSLPGEVRMDNLIIGRGCE